MSDKQFTIVIPVYNNYKYTMQCIGSIFRSDYPKDLYEIFVVDNASTDKTNTFLTYLQECDEPIRIIQNKTNAGYLLAANQGWKYVKTPFCLHLNNDVVLSKGTISLMMEQFNKDPAIGIVGSIQVSADIVDGKTTEISHLFHTYFYRGDEFDKTKEIVYTKPLTEEEKQMDYIEVDSIGFACAMIKKEVWEKIGYFDTRFAPCMAEQEDYVLRTKEAGFKIVITPKTCFLHAIGATTTGNESYFADIVRRNKILFKEKWGEKLRDGLI